MLNTGLEKVDFKRLIYKVMSALFFLHHKQKKHK